MGKTVAPSGSKSNGAAANGSTDFITLPNGKQVSVSEQTGSSYGLRQQVWLSNAACICDAASLLFKQLGRWAGIREPPV